jgi:hypothetical protein
VRAAAPRATMSTHAGVGQRNAAWHVWNAVCTKRRPYAVVVSASASGSEPRARSVPVAHARAAKDGGALCSLNVLGAQPVEALRRVHNGHVRVQLLLKNAK